MIAIVFGVFSLCAMSFATMRAGEAWGVRALLVPLLTLLLAVPFGYLLLLALSLGIREAASLHVWQRLSVLPARGARV